VGSIRLVAKFVGHQAMPEITDAEREAGRGRRVGEAEAGQARHDDVEGVGGVGTVRGRIGEHRNQPPEADERIGKAVGEDDRKWIRAASALVNEMNTHAGDLGPEVCEPIQLRFLRSPVEAQLPVFDELVEKRRARAVAPLVDVRVHGPARPRQSCLKVIERRLRDMDRIRFYAHGAPRLDCRIGAGRVPPGEATFLCGSSVRSANDVTRCSRDQSASDWTITIVRVSCS
jgi:hypothetical protein